MSQSQSDQFRQYAEEAMLSASQSKNEPEIKALADLAHVLGTGGVRDRARRSRLQNRPLEHGAALYQL